MLLPYPTFIEANNLSFAEGCVIKYLLRHKQKGGIEDLKKARHYIDLIIDTNYGDKHCKQQKVP